MPLAAPKQCAEAGCNVLVRGLPRCEKHKRIAWVKKYDAPARVAGRRLQRMREQLFSERPLCVECLKHGRVSAATQRDHVIALCNGGADDASNVQGLCDTCHDIKTAKDIGRKPKGNDVSGMPTDPNHHWLRG